MKFDHISFITVSVYLHTSVWGAVRDVTEQHKYFNSPCFLFLPLSYLTSHTLAKYCPSSCLSSVCALQTQLMLKRHWLQLSKPLQLCDAAQSVKQKDCWNHFQQVVQKGPQRETAVCLWLWPFNNPLKWLLIIKPTVKIIPSYMILLSQSTFVTISNIRFIFSI